MHHAVWRHPASCLSTLALAVHLWANAGYGVFRDELYFIVCGEHLAWGYVDQPPLVPALAALSWHLSGGSLLGLRLIPALALAGTVALTVHAARLLGGGPFAAWLAGMCVLASTVLELLGVLFSTDTLQPLLWLALACAMIRAVRDDKPFAWLAVGALIGIALLTKYMIAFEVAALGAALMLTPQRRVLARWQLWAGLLIAAALAAPNLWWQAAHGWPFLQIAHAAANGKNIVLSPAAFLEQEVLLLNPVTLPVWLTGLVALLVWRRFTGLRWLAIGWIILIALMILEHGKPYYPAASYPVLFAAGAVALEAWLRWPAARVALAGLVAAGGAALLPFGVPVLPVASFIAYEARLGLVPSTGEHRKVSVLPQYYADMFGWPELAALVARAYAALPATDRADAVFLAGNYGEAAAIDVLGVPSTHPPTVSPHNNYFLWGVRGHDGDVALAFGVGPALLARLWRGVEPVGQLDVPFAMPDETGRTLYLCRDPLTPIAIAWPHLRHYD